MALLHQSGSPCCSGPVVENLVSIALPSLRKERAAKQSQRESGYIKPRRSRVPADPEMTLLCSRGPLPFCHPDFELVCCATHSCGRQRTERRFWCMTAPNVPMLKSPSAPSTHLNARWQRAERHGVARLHGRLRAGHDGVARAQALWRQDVRVLARSAHCCATTRHSDCIMSLCSQCDKCIHMRFVCSFHQGAFCPGVMNRSREQIPVNLILLFPKKSCLWLAP